MKDNYSDKLLLHLIKLCRDISRGKYGKEKELFELTKEGVYPELITALAEAFGMMMVQVESRQYHLEGVIDELKKVGIDLLAAKNRLSHENIQLRQTLRQNFSPVRILGNSAKLLELLDKVSKIADTPVNVLITGETGTGKELIAKTIHYNSLRSDKPFIALNCTAIPESIFEAEMFGVEKGVATGVDKRIGRIEQADGGTLFFDEIGDMPLATQAKILRVIQDRQLDRVGGRKAIPVDVRIIAATHKDLRQAISEKTFREDLFYRLNVIHLHIPPLRDRAEDIPVLLNYFLEQSIKRLGRPPIRFSKEAIELLTGYSWPGNVRELENEIERAVALAASDMIDVDDLRASLRLSKKVSEGNVEEPASLKTAEYGLILKTLDLTKGNRSEAARLLCLSREGLRKKMKRYGMTT
ncbi:MAG: Regulatory protein AtoC [Syntrophus sp. SKADARSKE-3]|nr:Regulatory protein AtoC [Syntrophus sp. SKADARSKE-3]